MKCGRKLDLYVESTTRIYGPANVAVTRRVSGTPVVREAHSAEPQRTFPSCKSKLLYQTADSLSVSRQLLAFLTERIIRSYQQHHIPRGLFFLPRLLYNLNMDKKAPKTAIHPNPFFHKRPPEEQPKTALGFFLHLQHTEASCGSRCICVPAFWKHPAIVLVNLRDPKDLRLEEPRATARRSMEDQEEDFGTPVRFTYHNLFGSLWFGSRGLTGVCGKKTLITKGVISTSRVQACSKAVHVDNSDSVLS